MPSSSFSALLLGVATVRSFYLPGIKPHEYAFQESVKIKVNKLDSVQTQLPYDYYALPFCAPTSGVKRDAENLGEIMSGDSIENSPYTVEMMLRMIPVQPWYMQRHFAVLVGGVLPFGAVFIEVFFIMSSIWLHHYYYMFGFLLLVFIILILTSAEITIVMTYFQLCAEDWRWWWRSVLTAGSSAAYLFAYSILYFYTKLDIESGPTHWVSSLLYFGYMALVSLAFFLVTGTIGFYATYQFVHKIYDAIKVE